jgi:hypothetical protein
MEPQKIQTSPTYTLEDRACLFFFEKKNLKDL